MRFGIHSLTLSGYQVPSFVTSSVSRAIIIHPSLAKVHLICQVFLPKACNASALIDLLHPRSKRRKLLMLFQREPRKLLKKPRALDLALSSIEATASFFLKSQELHYIIKDLSVCRFNGGVSVHWAPTMMVVCKLLTCLKTSKTFIRLIDLQQRPQFSCRAFELRLVQLSSRSAKELQNPSLRFFFCDVHTSLLLPLLLLLKGAFFTAVSTVPRWWPLPIASRAGCPRLVISTERPPERRWRWWVSRFLQVVLEEL